MLDILQALSLLGLIVTHYFLVRGCFSIKTELPIQGGQISSRLDRTADLLDEVAQLIADLSEATAESSIARPPAGFGDLLTSFLNNRMNMAVGNGDTTQQQDWEVLAPNENPTNNPTE